MKIYISQDDRKSGPHTQDEVRELLYRGDVRRSALARVDGETEWVQLDSLLSRPESRPAVAVPPKIAVPIEQLRDPKEKTAFIWLCVAAVPGWLFLAALIVMSFGAWLAIMALGALVALIAELWFAAYVRTNAVRVSPTQLPELCRAVQAGCQRLGMAAPDVYVLQQNTWNAFATRILGRNMVVLLSGAVDSILLKGDMAQLTWLIGHELGHHRAGHLLWWRKLAAPGNWCIWLRLWYSRRCELTCDRMGLYCAGNLHTCQRALMNATVGAQLADQVNLKEASQQWEGHRGEFFVQYRTLYATHPHHLARLWHLQSAALELGIPG